MIAEKFVMSNAHTKKAIQIIEDNLKPIESKTIYYVTWESDYTISKSVKLKQKKKGFKILGFQTTYTARVVEFYISDLIEFEVYDGDFLKLTQDIAKQVEEMFKKNKLDVPIIINKKYVVE